MKLDFLGVSYTVTWWDGVGIIAVLGTLTLAVFAIGRGGR